MSQTRTKETAVPLEVAEVPLKRRWIFQVTTQKAVLFIISDPT
jgi:hypothetical protein